ncbi:MAG: helix-turn-helix transcriptional regulator [Paraperlucidibaca sp.]|nr:helix-turn-helix transcriptional regulator [Paraperlucidibaca sp.]MBQ0722305.1 helix-turn-helix transcriptional regulator [Paraperlucidibaca sp.]
MHFLSDVSSRLQSERKRIGLSQENFGKELGVSKRTQASYEGGTNLPDASYLIAAKQIGVDINYVLFGTLSDSSLGDSEQGLLAMFRDAPPLLKAAVIGALRAGLSTNASGAIQESQATVIKKVVGQANTGVVTNNANKMKFGK